MEMVEKQKERKDEIKFITIDHSKCELHINNKSHKKPSLICFNDFVMPRKEKINNYKDLSVRCLENWNEVIVENKLNDDEEKELIKAIYEHIKEEIAYNQERKSEILKYIIEHKIKVEQFEKLIKEDIKEIKTSTFGHKPLIDLLDQNIKLSETLLNPQIILSIMMNNDIERLRRGNEYILRNNNDACIETFAKESQANMGYLTDQKTKIKDLLKSKKKLILKKQICAGLLTMCLMGSVTYTGIGTFFGRQFKYSTTTTQYTSLGEESKNTTLNYEKTKALKTLEIYNEPYTEDGKLVRSVETYDISTIPAENYEDYYTLDITQMTPIKTEIVELTNKSQFKTYKAVNYVVDEERSAADIIFLNTISFVILNIMILLIPYITLYIIKIKNKKKIELLDKDIDVIAKEITQLMRYYDCIVERYGDTVEGAMKLCDEIICMDKLNDLTPEQQKIIEKYKKIKQTKDTMSEYISDQELQESIETYKLLKTKKRNNHSW